MTKSQRRVVVTFIVAGLAAVVGEHMLKPQFKKGMRL